MSDLTSLTDDELQSRIGTATERETEAHEAIRNYEDRVAREGASPAQSVEGYTPLQDALDAAEADLEALEAEQQRRRG